MGVSVDSGTARGVRQSDRLSSVRCVLGYAAILGTVPYLALKMAWLSGSAVGLTDARFGAESSMVALNTATAVMDAVVIVLALVFAHPWGQRVPAWLVLLPIWVGTGFLAPLALGMPLAGVAALAGADVGLGGGDIPLESWVRPVVYGGFAWQGVMLLAAFVLYAFTRWREVLTRPAGLSGATRGVQLVVGRGAALAAVVIAGAHLARAGGATLGMSARQAEAATVSTQVADGMDDLFAVAAAVGVLLLLHGRTGRFWIPIALTWVGAGALFSWGGWALVQVLGNTALSSGATPALDNFLNLVKALTGVLLGLVALMLLAERAHGHVPAAAQR